MTIDLWKVVVAVLLAFDVGVIFGAWWATRDSAYREDIENRRID